jgi:hypothetical protein
MASSSSTGGNANMTNGAAQLANPGTTREGSLLRRSMHVMTDLFSPFSSSALATLPQNPRGFRERDVRAHRPFRSYNATDDSQIPVPVPKKVMTPIRVETKVWLALERSMYFSPLTFYIVLCSILGGWLMSSF